MLFLEGIIWRESDIIFFKPIQVMSRKNWARNELQNFFIRSYRSEIRVSMSGRVWLRVSARDRLLISIKGKTQWGRKKHIDFDSIKWPQGDVCIGIMSRRLKEKKLVRVDKLSTLQERKAKKGWRAEVFFEICKVELQFILGQSFLILSRNCIRYWNHILIR